MHQQKENREIVEKALERGYRGEDTLESLLYSLATGDKKTGMSWIRSQNESSICIGQ